MRFLVSTLLLAACEAEVPEQPEYERDVRPIIDVHCLRCHNEARDDGGVRLDGFDWAQRERIGLLCTSLDSAVADTFAGGLGADQPEGCRGWRPSSMPPGAIERMSLREQEIIGRWATGLEETP